jgi:signal transduction histidine kinase
MKNKITNQETLQLNKELFYKEEFKGEKIVSYIRIFILASMAIMTFIKAGIFSGKLIMNQSISFTIILLIISVIYSAVLFVIYKFNIYHPIMKYFSSSIDLTICVLSIFVYRFGTHEEYATIYFIAKYSALFIMLSLTLLRYSFWLSVSSGILVGLEYLFLIIWNNQMNNLSFYFVAPEGQVCHSTFYLIEEYLKVVYLIIAGFMTGILSNNFKQIVINSILKEQEKTNLMMDNAIIETINTENKKYLDNIQEGLLIINNEFLIKGHYSKHLEQIFEQTGFEGSNFIDFIYPDKTVQEEKRMLLKKFLNLLLKNTLVDNEILNDVNPLKNETIIIKKENGETVEKIISASFTRIENSAVIEEIMVIFDDKTLIVKAEKELVEEKIKRETELENISVILRAEQEYLLEFIEDTIKTLDNFELRLDDLSKPAVLNEMFREMHSLKGIARSLEFKSVSQAIHEIENTLALLRDNKQQLTFEIKNDLRKKVNVIFIEIENIKKLQEKFKKFSNIKIETRKTQTVEEFIDNLKNMTEDIAKENLKKINFHSENNLKEQINFLKEIKNPIIHIVRNSIDHGIEDRFERITKGKDEFGNIKLRLNNDDSNFIFEVIDDGSGIDFNKVKIKAEKLGYIQNNENIPDKKLLNLLFLPGFSTSEEITDLSGRGVGLDVVKEIVNKLNGKISVATEKDKGTKFTIKIPKQPKI